MDVLEYSLTLKERPVALIGQDGEKREYVLRELNGDGRDQWQSKVVSGISIDTKGGNHKVKSLDGIELLLVHLSLYDSNDKQVSLEAIKKFPAGVVDGLADAARKLSSLDQEESAKLGNE